jgi:hypothetical protein
MVAADHVGVSGTVSGVSVSYNPGGGRADAKMPKAFGPAPFAGGGPTVTMTGGLLPRTAIMRGRSFWALAAAVVSAAAGCTNVNTFIGGRQFIDEKNPGGVVKYKEWVPPADRRYIRTAEAGWVAYTAEEHDAVARLAAAGRPAGQAPKPLSAANVVVVRSPLVHWESADNVFEDSPSLRALDSWAAAGRWVGLRIDCTRRADAPAHLVRDVKPVTAIDGGPPKFWDGDYQGHHERLLRAVADRLRRNPAALALVIVTGADWDAPYGFPAAGLPDGEHKKLVEYFVTMYQSVFGGKGPDGRPEFPNARFFISAGAITRNTTHARELSAWLRSRRVGVMLDRKAAPDTGQGPAEELPEGWTGRDGVMLGEGFAELWGADGAGPAFDRTAARMQPRYAVLAPSPDRSQSVCSEHGARLEEIGARMGPRIRVAKALIPIRVDSRKPMEVRLTWVNEGTVPPADPYQVMVNFVTTAGDADPSAFVGDLPDDGGKAVPVGNWTAGFEKTFALKLTSPSVPVGGGEPEFSLTVALVAGPQPEARKLPLPIADPSPRFGCYNVGKLKVGS